KTKELQSGFYICNAVFQLFEDVYVDLKLEDEYDHPDNRGWMNFFKHWSWAPMFRVAWTISASNYGARFQNFCARHLELTVGEVSARPVEWEADIDIDRANLPTQFKWRKSIADIADAIVDGIWTWVSELPVGSDILAKAALTVMEEVEKFNKEKSTGALS